MYEDKCLKDQKWQNFHRCLFKIGLFCWFFTYLSVFSWQVHDSKTKLNKAGKISSSCSALGKTNCLQRQPAAAGKGPRLPGLLG